MATATSVAAYLGGKGLTGKLQLQKLLYYVQAWNLAWTGRPLFSEEIEAWPMGPVVRSVWAASRQGTDVTDVRGLSADDIAVIEAVYSHYGRIPGARLADMTHSEEPWIEARDGLPPEVRSSAAISQATMRRFFTRMAATGTDGPVPPVRIGQAHPLEVRAAGDRQRDRWRGALDALAER